MTGSQSAPQFDGSDVSSEIRVQLNQNMKEGVTPEGTFSDWGDEETDYPTKSQSSGVSAASPEEVDEYWRTLRSANVEIPDQPAE